MKKRLKDVKDKDKFGKYTFGDIELWIESTKDGVILICVPEELVSDLRKWYHSALIHPGLITCTIQYERIITGRAWLMISRIT